HDGPDPLAGHGHGHGRTEVERPTLSQAAGPTSERGTIHRVSSSMPCDTRYADRHLAGTAPPRRTRPRNPPDGVDRPALWPRDHSTPPRFHGPRRHRGNDLSDSWPTDARRAAG